MENNIEDKKYNNMNDSEYIIITSKKNTGVIEAFKLNEKKYREEYGKYIAEGKKLFEEAILYNSENILEVYILSKLLEEENFKKLIVNLKEKNNNVRIIIATEDVISKISKQKNPEGIITIIKKYEEKKLKYIKKENDNNKDNIKCIPVFENISDPNNLGAILRVVSSLGIKEIITIGDQNVDRYSPKVLRSSMGGFFKVDIIKSDIYEIVNNFKNLDKGDEEKCCEVVYTDMFGENLYQFSEKIKNEKSNQNGLKNILIIFGNEANGVTNLVKENIEKSITIPMVNTTESLNLATSVSIILYELNRAINY